MLNICSNQRPQLLWIQLANAKNKVGTVSSVVLQQDRTSEVCNKILVLWTKAGIFSKEEYTLHQIMLGNLSIYMKENEAGFLPYTINSSE